MTRHEMLSNALALFCMCRFGVLSLQESFGTLRVSWSGGTPVFIVPTAIHHSPAEVGGLRVIHQPKALLPGQDHGEPEISPGDWLRKIIRRERLASA